MTEDRDDKAAEAAAAAKAGAGPASEDAEGADGGPDVGPGSTPDPASDPKSGTVSERASGAVSERASGTVTERASGTVTERASGAVSERASGAVSERASGAVSERASGAISDPATDPTSGRLPDSAPDSAPDRAPNQAPDPDNAAGDRAPARRETGRQPVYAPGRKDGAAAEGAGAPEAPSENAEDIGASLQALENATLTAFAADRDALIDDMVPAAALPADRDEFYHRDPFSGDYVDYVNAREGSRTDGGAKVARKLREDLLSKPHLLPKPEEGANRGAAAVWRSLRDQLHQESLGMIDSSDREELLILKGDLMTRKALVDSVGEGLTNLIKRLDQRLAAFDKTPPKVDDGVATSAPDAASLKGKI